MKNRERYLINAIGDDHQATEAGVKKFLTLCQKHGDGIIFVPTMQQVDSTLLGGVLGESLAKSLAKHKNIKLPTGQNIDLCSDKTFNNYKNGDVYLALWATESMIDKTETSYSCKASVVVTWLEDDADKWIEQYKPTKLSW